MLARLAVALNHRHYLSPEARVGQTHHPDILDRRVLLQHSLDFLGEDFLAAGVNAHIVAADEFEGSVRRPARAVPGHQPTLAIDHREGRRVFLGFAEIAQRQRPCARDDAHCVGARLHFVQGLVEQLGLAPGQRLELAASARSGGGGDDDPRARALARSQRVDNRHVRVVCEQALLDAGREHRAR